LGYVKDWKFWLFWATLMLSIGGTLTYLSGNPDLNRAAPRRVYRRVHRNHTFSLVDTAIENISVVRLEKLIFIVR